MSFSYYNYSNYGNDAPQLAPVFNQSYNSNIPSFFQEKNDIPVRPRTQFNYVNIIKENHDRRQQQLNELRLSHAKRRALLSTRFDILPAFDPLRNSVMK